MKKRYNASLTSHGTVGKLTKQIGSSGTDTYQGSPVSGISNPGTGSINVCATTNLNNCYCKTMTTIRTDVGVFIGELCGQELLP